MADLSFFSSSPWMMDTLLSRDGLLGGDCDLAADYGLELYDTDASRSLPSWSDWASPPAPGSLQGSDVSVSNSDCSDTFSIDIEDLTDRRVVRDKSPGPRATISTILGDDIEENLTYDPLADLDYDSSDLEEDGGVDIEGDSDDEDTDSSLCYRDLYMHSREAGSGLHHKDRENPLREAGQRKRSLSECLEATVQWTSLSPYQQVELVESLSAVISKQLGLREQLEVIRIINPHAALSPTDTEFAIDLTCLNDVKLLRVREYIKKHMQDTQNNNNSQSRGRSGSHGNARNRCHHNNRQTPGRKNNHYDDKCSSCEDEASITNNSSNSHRKKATKRPQQQEWKAKTEERKRSRQDRKEERSGLFVQEEVMAVTPCDDNHVEDDVDILT